MYIWWAVWSHSSASPNQGKISPFGRCFSSGMVHEHSHPLKQQPIIWIAASRLGLSWGWSICSPPIGPSRSAPFHAAPRASHHNPSDSGCKAHLSRHPSTQNWPRHLKKQSNSFFQSCCLRCKWRCWWRDLGFSTYKAYILPLNSGHSPSSYFELPCRWYRAEVWEHKVFQHSAV